MARFELVVGARRRIIVAAIAAVALLLARAAPAQPLDGDALVAALGGGGYVIAMRHASSPLDVPAQAVPGNVDRERQLDELGVAMVTGMRYAFRVLEIPIGDVYTSPAFRARETAQHFGFGERRAADPLARSGGDTAAAWLRAKVAEPPPDGTNTLLVTHARNLQAAFGADAADLADGEALIFRPSDGRAELVARVPIERWSMLAIG